MLALIRTKNRLSPLNPNWRDDDSDQDGEIQWRSPYCGAGPPNKSAL